MNISVKQLLLPLLSLGAFLFSFTAHADDWDNIVKEAKGQTVYFNAWGGSETINDYIRWAADRVEADYGVKVVHVKANAGDVVSRVLAEKEAGRMDGGTIDLAWINGENFRSMKSNGLLADAYTQRLPNYAFVDTENKPTTLYDFTTPVDNLEAPWGMAQLVFMYDSAKLGTPPSDMKSLLKIAKQNKGRVTYPAPPNFHGTTFVKQALLELTSNPKVLSKPVSEADFEKVTAPLWAYLDELHPNMWRKGESFTNGAPEMKTLLNDGEIFVSLSFNPNDASNAIANDELPNTVKSYVHTGGTIGNTHFVGMTFNSTVKAGAMVFSNFLMSPEAQAKKADTAVWGDPTVLSMAKLSMADKKLFDSLPMGAATLSPSELGAVLLEPHSSWVEALEKAWQERYSQ